MDFAQTPEMEHIRVEIRKVLAEELPDDWQGSGFLPMDVRPEHRELAQALDQRLAAERLIAPAWPSAYGGRDLTPYEQFALYEELGYALAPRLTTISVDLVGPILILYGSDEQRTQHLPAIANGALVWCQGFSEPGAGSDLTSLQTKAARKGDVYVVNGHKLWITNGEEAGIFIVFATMDPDAGYKGITAYIVEKGTAGFSIGKKEDKLGIRASTTTELIFDNVRVPATNLIGGENQGWKVATTHLELEHGSGGRIGRNWLVDRLFEHCKTTQRRGETLTKDPDVRDRLVDVYIEAEIARLFNLRNYWMRHSKVRMTYEGPQTSYFRKTSGLRMSAAILDILGPSALTYDPKWGAADGHMEAHQRSAIVALHPGGTADIQKVIMARRIGIGREVREQAGALA